jgi:hypothetical protein
MNHLQFLSLEWFRHQRRLRMLEKYLVSQIAPPHGYTLLLSASMPRGGGV